MKINRIEKKGRYLEIYVKIPYFSNYMKMNDKLKKYYDEDSSCENFIDRTGKFIVMRYLLRNKKDILPYIKYGTSK